MKHVNVRAVAPYESEDDVYTIGADALRGVALDARLLERIVKAEGTTALDEEVADALFRLWNRAEAAAEALEKSRPHTRWVEPVSEEAAQ
jgi:hypothetical protein